MKKVADGRLDGTAQLKDADFSAPDWNLKLDKLNGPLRFDLHGLQAGPLDAVFRGQPSKLNWRSRGPTATRPPCCRRSCTAVTRWPNWCRTIRR